MRTTVDVLWVDDPANPDPTPNGDPAESEVLHLLPPVNGSHILVVTFDPLPEGWEPAHTQEEIAAVAARWDTGGVFANDPPIHTTPTIDYGIVLSGEIDLELDEGTVHLRPGDVVVQRGTRHAWYNRGTEPCTLAFAMISSPNYR
jgi:mannose-6-phosphate isomerase-like protein (cupin superfamily)